MENPTSLSTDVRKALLLKVISKPQPKRDDVDSVIELMLEKLVDTLHAQSMSFYVIEGNYANFRGVYYSPTLYADDPDKEEFFTKKKAELLGSKIPTNEGLIGKVFQTGEPSFYSIQTNQTRPSVQLLEDTEFEIKSMLTVPLKGSKVIGAIQVLNKEPEYNNGIFSNEDLDVLQEVAEYSAVLLQRMLDPNFHLSDKDTAKFISQYTNTELIVDSKNLPIDNKLLEMIGDKIIRKEGVFLYKKVGPSSVAALITNPLDYVHRESFTKATDLAVEEVYVAPASLIDKLTKQYFKDNSKGSDIDMEAEGDMAEIADIIGSEYANDGDNKKGDAFENEDSAPIIQLANCIIEDAYVCGASDIHIEPHENSLVVRYRVDGLCQEKLSLYSAVCGALVEQIKVMCDLDIAEKRLPQDGRIIFKKYTKKNVDIDLRVATARTNFGEKVVMRILDKNTAAMPITALGFSEENLKRYRVSIRQPYGMILHCGPTGSGKSMTLFSALREVVRPEINVQTAEDPIEYTIPGINQMQMQSSIGLTFARTLRAFLQMDPDIILVGEIRDTETASIAVEAALTGHLLLSTLHTNDAPSTVARFTDMRVEPFMISASMLVICAQRLMRRLCKNCKIAYEPTSTDLEFLERALDSIVKLILPIR